MRMWGPLTKSLHLFAKHFTAPPIDCTHGFAICSALVQVRHQTCLVKRTSTVVFGWNCRGYMLTPYRIAFSCRHEKLSAYHSMNRSIRYVTLHLRDRRVGTVRKCEQKPYPVFFFAPAEKFSRIVWTQPEYIFAFQCAASNCGRTSIASVLTRYSLKSPVSSNSVCISGTHLVQPL